MSSSLARQIARILMLVVGGAVAGFSLGAAIFAFGSVIGRSGSTGTEYLGYWNLGSVLFKAREYGIPIGVIMTPIGYLVLPPDLPVWRAVAPLAGLTLTGGMLGALVAPPVAALGGVVAFFMGCLYFRARWEEG